MRKSSLTNLFFLTLGMSSLHAQYYRFTQTRFNDQLVNPAIHATSPAAELKIFHQDYRLPDQFNIRGSFLSGHYPIPHTRQSRSSIGLFIGDDREGIAGIYKTNILSASYALSLAVSPYQQLSFGINTGWTQREVSLNGLFTGSQFVPDRGFLNTSSGEPIEQFQTDFMSLNAGLFWKKTNKEGEQLAHFGLSLFDMNRPNESLLGTESNLASTAVLVAGFQWYRNQKWAYYPEVVMTHQSNLSYLVGGLRTTYAPDHRKRQSFHVLTKYASVGVMVVGFQYENENLLVGGSYDVPISRSFKETTTVEIGLTLREKIAPDFRRKIRRKRTIKRSSKSKRPNRNRLSKRQLANETNSSDREALSENSTAEESSVPPIMEEEVHEEDTIKTQSNVGELERFPPFHQGNTIKLTFKSNESTIDAPSETTLRFLAHYLQRNPNVRIQIVGHTDDVGSNLANQKLSLKRATSIKAFLLGATIASDRIKVTGRGEIDPLVPNTSSKNRSINRRVEIILN